MTLSGKIIIPIETLTPVWTGDADRKTSYLRATSFLGGLRFWTEALLRSLGKEACDITGKDRCVHDPDEGKPACAACQIFGCTGLGRSFSLRVNEKNLSGKSIGKVQLPHHQYGKDQVPSWPLEAPGKAGDFNLILSPLRPGKDRAAALDPLLALAARLLLHWGMLGAKDQYGYGLVANTPPQAFTHLIGEGLKAAAGRSDPADNSSPVFQDFFFFAGKPRKNSRETPFEIRYQVRGGLREPTNNRDLRHYFCGDIHGNRQASKFNMALVNGSIYGWGWFPRDSGQPENRDRCLNLLKEKMAANCQEVRWKEFKAGRDNCLSPKDWSDFLKDLALNPWR